MITYLLDQFKNLIKIFRQKNIPIDFVFNKKVSFQPNAWSKINKELSILNVLNEIKSGKYSDQINALRQSLSDKKYDEYESNKKRLPAVTFCGTFNSNRKKDTLIKYNEIIVLDVDKLNADEIDKLKEVWRKDKYVFSFWESPSQKGMKGLVYLSYKIDINLQPIDVCHKIAFNKLCNYFEEKHRIKLDETGSDITRLCFYSCDPDLTLKRRIVAFSVDGSDLVGKKEELATSFSGEVLPVNGRDVFSNSDGKNDPKNRKRISAIIKYLTKRHLSITYTYDEWYKVAYAIANSFTYNLGEKYFLQLSSLDPDKYDEGKCRKQLQNCYKSTRGEISFDLIVRYANLRGFESVAQSGGGVPKVVNQRK